MFPLLREALDTVLGPGRDPEESFLGDLLFPWLLWRSRGSAKPRATIADTIAETQLRVKIGYTVIRNAVSFTKGGKADPVLQHSNRVELESEFLLYPSIAGRGIGKSSNPHEMGQSPPISFWTWRIS